MFGLLIHWWELGWRVLCLGLLDVEPAQALPIMAYVVQQCTATTDWTLNNRPSAAHSLCVLTAAAAAAAAATATAKASRATRLNQPQKAHVAFTAFLVPCCRCQRRGASRAANKGGGAERIVSEY